jgi:X-X-X-Leu-X-X-Gly heptad repeat protein
MGKTDLGKWMITNGGEYSADATYEQLTMVKYGNSTYITLKTVTGITPVDDKINFQLMAQGFDATALSAVQAEDTQGLCGEKGNIVTAQSLVDALADKVINTVMTKIGTAALTGGMTDLSSGLNKLYSNLTPSGITDVSHAIKLLQVWELAISVEKYPVLVDEVDPI